MYTLIILVAAFGGTWGSAQISTVPGFATRTDCINARIMVGNRFDDGRVRITTLCVETPGVQND